MQTAVAKDGGRGRLARTRVLDVTVLMGGPSTEREVSLISGGAVSAALERLGHKVTRSDINSTDLSALDRPGIDVVFIALHGAFGESGEVQELCERRGLAYTGSGPRASKLAMDKVLARAQFQQAGLLCAAGVHVRAGQDLASYRSRVDALGLPAVVKPVDGGSSVDLTIARDAASRDASLAAVLAKYSQVLVEQYVAGIEVTVGILDQQALPPIQIVPSGEFYDYTAKYADGSGTQYRFDLPTPATTVQELQAGALRAYQALGCRDMSRVDFIITPAGQCFVLEANTIPGFTSHSLLPMAAAKAGLSFDQLVSRLLEMALARRDKPI